MSILQRCRLVVLMMILPGLAAAQVTTGTISGTVRDITGAVVPGAEITINHQETGNVRRITTDSQGRYLVPNLALGQYSLQATTGGFQTVSRTGVRLTLGQQAVINFTLSPGAVAETVTVVGEAPLVDTSTSAVGNLVAEEQINELPLNGRDYVQLVLLQPGVVQYREQNRELNRGMGVRMSIGGARANQVSYRLNGLDIADGAGTTPGSVTGNNLGVDAIQEFQVLTNTYSSEYGKSAGGVINVVHKSGTNQLHGSAFEFLRNDNFDANRWENNRFTGGLKPEFRRNQFGGSAGGPISQDRLFFFGAFEGLRDASSETTVANVLSMQARQGYLGGNFIGIDPVAQPYIDSIPLPNVPGSEDERAGTAQIAHTFATSADENYIVGKMDYTLSESDMLAGSYTFNQGLIVNPAPRGGMPTLTTNQRSRAQYVTLRYTHTFTPTVLNTFNAGFNRSKAREIHVPIYDFPQSLAFLAGAEWQTFEITNLGRLEYNFTDDSDSGRDLVLNTWQFSDNLTIVKGSHTLKLGVEAYRFGFRYVTDGRAGGGGRFQFRGVRQFLQADTRRWEVQDPQAQGRRASIFQEMYGAYVQDDIRVTPSLTLNLGMRYEIVTTPRDKLPHQSTLRSLTDPQLTTSHSWWSRNPSLSNFAPRVGFAWDVSGTQRTAVRGGFGLFMDPLTTYYHLPTIQNNPPFRLLRRINGAVFPGSLEQLRATQNAAFQLTLIEAELDQPYRIQYNLGFQHEIMPDTSVGVWYVGAQGVHTSQMYLNANTRIPSFDSSGRIFFDENAHPGDVAGRVNPNFTTMQYRGTGGHSSYNSLQLQLQRRAGGLQFQTSYTWSKSLDNGSIFTYSSEGGNTVSLQNFYQPHLERGVSAFDARHVFTSNAHYDLPELRDANAVTRSVLGGWQLGGIFTVSTGHPFTPYMAFDNANLLTRSRGDHLRPDVKPGADLRNAVNPDNPEQYFDAAALFQLPPEGYLGNMSRTPLVGPGNFVVDFTLKKRFLVGESKSLEFRSEFFNLFNRPNFRAPESDERRVFSSRGSDGQGVIPSSAGQITSTTGSARQIQFGLRFEF